MRRFRRIAPPVVALERNVVAARSLDDRWGVWKLDGRSYQAESLETRQAIVADLELFAARVQADFQILRVSRRWDAGAYIGRLAKHPPVNAHKRMWVDYLASQQEALERAAVWSPSTWLSVRLADPSKDLHAHISELLNRPVSDVRKVVAGRPSTRSRDELDLTDSEDRLHSTERRVTSSLRGRAATEEEVQWLVRRVFGRGLTEPRIVPARVLRLPGQQRRRSLEWWLDEALIGPRHGHLEISDGFATDFQAGVCLGEIGDAAPFTRECELMFTAIEGFPFPVDACLSVRWMSSASAERQARTRFGRNRAALEEASESEMGALADDVDEAGRARELHGRISQTREPLLFGTMSLSVFADSQDELRSRIIMLRDELPHQWYHPSPKADQLQLGFSMFPGQAPRVPGYERLFTCEQIGAMVPHATHSVGADSHRGGKPTRALHFARTIHGDQPVFWDMWEAWETDQTPTVALLGSLGGGKTMLLQVLEYQAFIAGARIVDVDPKGDHRLSLMPGVRERAKTIVLGLDAEHRGQLDPLRVAPDNEQHTSAVTFLSDVMGLNPDAWEERGALQAAVSETIDAHRERASCMAVIDYLDAKGNLEQKIAKTLRGYAAGGIASLGFAQIDDPLPQQAEEQFTYLNIRALDTPHVQTARSEMSHGELHGRAVMQLVALYAMRILGKDRDRPKVLGFDETSFIRTVGARLLDQLARWSRSEKALPILSTQMLHDISSQDGLIGHYFQFRMKSTAQAEAALRVLELDTDGPLRSAITQRYGHAGHEGECLYRDLRGRCEEIRVEPGVLLDPLRTTAPADRELVQTAS